MHSMINEKQGYFKTNIPSIYGKCSKISNTLFHIFLAYILLFMLLFLKVLHGMANIVDSDQTAPWGAVWSVSALFA